MRKLITGGGGACSKPGRGRAAPTFERALKLNPPFEECLNNLAVCYFELGRLADSARTFQTLIARDSKLASAYNGLGLVRIKQGRRSEAAAYFRKALQVDPHFWEAWLNLGIFYQEEGQRQQALRYLEEFTRGAPPAQFGKTLEEVRAIVARLRAGTR